MDERNHDLEFICLDELTDREWAEIYNFALKAAEEKLFQETWKNWIYGFLQWIDAEDKNVTSNDTYRTFH